MLAAETILGSSKHEELYYKQMIHSKDKGFIAIAEKGMKTIYTVALQILKPSVPGRKNR